MDERAALLIQALEWVLNVINEEKERKEAGVVETVKEKEGEKAEIDINMPINPLKNLT